MSIRKYISEFGLNMRCNFSGLFQQNELNNIHKFLPDPSIAFHIYIIGKRPRICLNPSSVVFTREQITGEFLVQDGFKFRTLPFSTANLIQDYPLSIEAPFPGTEFRVKNSKNEIVSGGKSALLFAITNPGQREVLDLEVLYVGQAYGEDGSRTAPARLASHSTLQNIYAEAIRSFPDQEIWVVLCSFEQVILTSFYGYKDSEKTLAEDTDHIERVLRNRVSEQQAINFTEAALIKYFGCPFNVVYRNTFPHPTHTTYSECYNLDLNQVCVELETENLGLRLKSESVKPVNTHFIQFPLHDSADRRAMFDFF